MKRKIFSVLLVLVLVLSFSLVTAVPVAAQATNVTLTMPDNVYRPAEFVVSSTTTNSGAAYDHVRFNITVDGPVDFTGNRADTFTITKVNGNPDTEGINNTFTLVGGDWVGYWGPEGGFTLPASYSATSTFTIEMDDSGTAPPGTYNITVELVDIDNSSAVLATATDSLSLSADTLYVGTGQQFTTIQAAVDAANPGETIIVHPGTYNENVLVNKDVTLQSAEKHEAEVVGVAYTGDVFRITADGATVEGFLVIIAAAHDGIAVKADNVEILNNKVKGPGPFTGYVPPTGAGISVMLADSVIVKGNSIHETSGAGIYMENVSNCTVADNKVVETQYTGILVWWYSHHNTITGNRVISAGTEWCYDDGIRLGFRADDNTVEYNHVNASTRHGIHAAPPTSNNIIQYNKMRGNGIPATGGVDARDRSTGGGTAGTANTWMGNKFRTAIPAGLQ